MLKIMLYLSSGKEVAILADKRGIKTIAQNKKARYEYFIIETYETGIELLGTEVKSIRQGKVNISDAYASIDNGEVIL